MQIKVSTEQIRKTYQQVSEKLQAISPSHEQDDYPSKLDRFLLILSALQLALFVPLAWWANRHPVDSTDVAITHALQKNKSPLWRYGALVVSYGSSPKLINVLVVPLAFILWKMHLRLAAIMTLGISWTSELIKTALKHILKRPRPSPLLVHVYKDGHGPSFPSGNVVTGMTIWGWLLVLALFLLKGKYSGPKGLLSIPALFVFLVGPSRVYLGDHWTSDVVGGYLLGGASLSSSVVLYNTLRKKGVLSRE